METARGRGEACPRSSIYPLIVLVPPFCPYHFIPLSPSYPPYPLRTIHGLPPDQWPRVLGKLHEDFQAGKDLSNWAKYLPNNDGTKGGYHHAKTGASGQAAAQGGTAAAQGEAGEEAAVASAASSPKAAVAALTLQR